MLWFKHDTNASQDAKLKKVRMKYGLEGYGLYWYCIELIAAGVDQNNLTFELEHDSEIISFDTGIHIERVNEMMAYMINLELFESNNNAITCLKMLKRLDQSMTSNKEMRGMINKAKINHDEVMTKSDLVMQEEKRIDKNRQDKTITNVKPKFDQIDLAFAQLAFDELLHHNPNHKAPNLNAWAEDARKMREIDNRDPNEMARVWTWIRNDSFWSTNILSISKFREKYDMVSMKAKGAGNPNLSKAGNATLNNIRDWEPT
jgi:hypothetical protein